MRKLMIKRLPDANSNIANFPRRRIDEMRCPRSAQRKFTPGGATAIFGSLTSTLAIVRPAMLAAKPRTIVSTSGNSGMS